jgi:hypothetical protein
MEMDIPILMITGCELSRDVPKNRCGWKLDESNILEFRKQLFIQKLKQYAVV